ncbi:MAG: hypothetical protein ACHQIK_09470 [Candidatus Acidiferrales bacterium]
MNEPESEFPISLAKQIMLAVQYAAKTAYAVNKVLTALSIVMKMDLHVRYSLTNHLRQRFH